MHIHMTILYSLVTFVLADYPSCNVSHCMNYSLNTDSNVVKNIDSWLIVSEISFGDLF